jgi:amidophosphoribosyltransferase
VGEAQRNAAKPQYCDACFSGEYPTRLTDLGDREAAVLGKTRVKVKG